MIFLTKPTREKIKNILISRAGAAYTYKEVGASFTENTIPSGFSVSRYCRFIGYGNHLFNIASTGISTCVMYELPFTEFHLINNSKTPEQGAIMAVAARHFGLWSVNPVRIVYKGEHFDNGEHFFSLAVGTLSGHEESGEEKFTTRLSKDNRVFYEVYSFHKPSRLILKIAYPVVNLVLKRFYLYSAEAIIKYCKKFADL